MYMKLERNKSHVCNMRRLGSSVSVTFALVVVVRLEILTRFELKKQAVEFNFLEHGLLRGTGAVLLDSIGLR